MSLRVVPSHLKQLLAGSVWKGKLMSAVHYGARQNCETLQMGRGFLGVLSVEGCELSGVLGYLVL